MKENSTVVKNMAPRFILSEFVTWPCLLAMCDFEHVDFKVFVPLSVHR